MISPIFNCIYRQVVNITQYSVIRLKGVDFPAGLADSIQI